MTAQATAQIGVTGLGVMGRNLARNFARHGYATALHNRTTARTDAIMAEFGHEGTFVPAHTAEEFVASLERPRRLVIMVNAGAATDAVIDEFAPLLEPGDMIIDGGNAHFIDTRRREAALREQGIHFVGMGVSGGEEGALNGPSIMPGGLGGVLPVPRPDARGHLREGRRRPLRHPRGPGRRRALREDGAQRHRVRRHAADRRGVRPAPPRRRVRARADRRDLPYLEPRPARLLPHRDHRRGPRAHRREDGPPLRRHRPRPGRAEGHRPVDRADRPRPGRAGRRDRGGRPSPAACPATPTCAPPPGAWPGPTAARRSPTPARSRTRSSRRSTPRRSCPTPRAGT